MTATMAKAQLDIQPFLFGEMAAAASSSPEQSINQSGKKVVDRLLRVRRELVGPEAAYVSEINITIERIRELSRFTPTQREELVLWAVEKSMATNVNEIAEDTRIDVDSVKEIVKALVEQKILYLAKRFIPGSGRQYYLIKSNRVKTPEVV